MERVVTARRRAMLASEAGRAFLRENEAARARRRRRISDPLRVAKKALGLLLAFLLVAPALRAAEPRRGWAFFLTGAASLGGAVWAHQESRRAGLSTPDRVTYETRTAPVHETYWDDQGVRRFRVVGEREYQLATVTAGQRGDRRRAQELHVLAGALLCYGLFGTTVGAMELRDDGLFVRKDIRF